MAFQRKIFFSFFQLLLVSLALPQLCCAVTIEAKEPAQSTTKHDQINEQELVICEQDLSGFIVPVVEQPAQRMTPHSVTGGHYGKPVGIYASSFLNYSFLLPAQTKVETKSPLYIAFQQLII
jgi:hypothetical protein